MNKGLGYKNNMIYNEKIMEIDFLCCLFPKNNLKKYFIVSKSNANVKTLQLHVH